MYRDAGGRKHYGYLKDSRSEIIILAGALGSPQLLMLNGIGPTEHLKSMGIPVLMDQPVVGQGKVDNPMNSIFIPTPYPAEKSMLQIVGITKFGSYIEASIGFGTTTDSIHKKYGIMSPKTHRSEDSQRKIRSSSAGVRFRWVTEQSVLTVEAIHEIEVT
eukprot:Gb_18148 [translate_table: standard]